MDDALWYVLRDLKRANAKTHAYKVLAELGFEVFTPMHSVLRSGLRGNVQRILIPVIPSLLFAHAAKSDLDKVVERTLTLQYCFVKGAGPNTPMIVPAKAMDDFMRAVADSDTCIYYAPGELTPDMIGRRVTIAGGRLDGLSGNLLKMRGSKKRRLIISLEGLLDATIEVEPDFIRLAD